MVDQITSGDHFDIYPAWSPDKSQIVFVSNRDGNDDLFLLDLENSNLNKLTNTEHREETPSWSPDGKQIAYVMVDSLSSGIERRSISLYSIETQQHQNLELSGLTNSLEPQWSPDGRFLLFTGQTEIVEDGVTSFDYGIYLLEVSTMTLHRLTSPGLRFDQPKWLPREGYFLSFLQSPGVVSSLSANIFELQQEGERYDLRPIFVVEDVLGTYEWGSNGEWFISVMENNRQDASVEDYFQSLDLAVVQIDLSSQEFPTSPPNSNYMFSFLENNKLITDNTFYDDYPDWSP